MDEPTTALDVVAQRQILDKIERLRKEFGFAYIFITHDLSLLLDVADPLAIMYAGEVIERSVRAGRRRPHTRTRWACCGRSRTSAAHAASCARAGQPARSPHRHSRLPVPAPLRLWVRGLRGHPPGAASPGCPGRHGLRGGLGSRAADWEVACHLHDPGKRPAGPPPALSGMPHAEMTSAETTSAGTTSAWDDRCGPGRGRDTTWGDT